MPYAEYRRQGFPITSCHVESTTKRINDRMKRTEIFWSVGGEALLQRCGDTLSDTRPLDQFWRDESYSATGQRSYDTVS
jgi:hypothetical protein